MEFYFEEDGEKKIEERRKMKEDRRGKEEWRNKIKKKEMKTREKVTNGQAHQWSDR